MAEFDPYLKWLGIRESARPVNHYRLLGLDLFESDPEVITIAADRQMAHIRTYQSGPNGDLSQKLLNELARARRCLLVKEKKLLYDQQLRSKLQKAEKANVAAVANQSAQAINPIAKDNSRSSLEIPEPQIVKPSGGFKIKSDPNAAKKKKKREKNELMLTLLGWVSGALAAVGVSAWLIGSGMLGNIGINPNDDDNQTVATNTIDETSGRPEPKKVTPGEKEENRTERTSKKNSTEKQNNASNAASATSLDSTSSKTNNSSLVGSNNSPAKTTAPVKTTASARTTASTKTALSRKLPNPPDFSSSVRWDPSTLGQYPVDAPNHQRLVTIAQQLIESRTVSVLPTEEISEPPTSKRKFVPRAGILIGMIATSAKDATISSLQPVFADNQRGFLLGPTGSRGTRPKLLVAEPGYAVGEIQRSINVPLNCVRLKFMKLSPSGLNPDEFYFSDWYGLERGPVVRQENDGGLPIVGVEMGMGSDRVVNHVSLIVGGKVPNAAPAKLVEISPTPPPASSSSTNDLTQIRKLDQNAMFVLKQMKINSFQDLADADLPAVYKALRESNSTVSVPTVRAWMDEAEKLAKSGGRKTNYNDPSSFGTPPNAGNTANKNPSTANLNQPKVAESIKKVAAPSRTELVKTTKDLSALYPELVRDHSIIGWRSLCEKLIKDAESASNEMKIKYTMLAEANRIAINIGNAKLAIEAVEEIDKEFEIDFWKRANESLEKASSKTNFATERDFKVTVDNLIKKAVQEEAFDEAKMLNKTASDIANRGGLRDLRDKYKTAIKDLNEMDRLALSGKSAMETLKTDATDPLANLNYGNYLFLVKSNMDRALSHWEKSNDADLSKLAKLEKTTSMTNNVLAIELAEQWEKSAGSGKSLRTRKFLERAVKIYDSVALRVRGLERLDVQKSARKIREKLN
jgi:hypothetical protein